MSTTPPPNLIKGSLASGGGILLLGLPRSGSLSLTTALRQLGYKHVHHATEQIHDVEQWESGIRAAHASFPVLTPLGQEVPPAFTKSDWDALFGQWQAISDFGSMFAPQLIEAYPDAKVVLVQRPFDAWFASFDKVFFQTLFSPIRAFLLQRIIAPVLNLPLFKAQPLAVLGFFDAQNMDEARVKARTRTVYEDHYANVRKMVKKENLLEFQLTDGWEPLCKFLRKDVPGEPFPRVNDSKNIEAFINKQVAVLTLMSVGVVLKRMAPILTFGLGYWVAQRGISISGALKTLQLR